MIDEAVAVVLSGITTLMLALLVLAILMVVVALAHDAVIAWRNRQGRGLH